MSAQLDTFQFLCPRHRNWLRERPMESASVWRSGFEMAQWLMASGNWEKAWRHAGCAFEAAQMMVQNAQHCDRQWVTHHSASAAQLSLVSERLRANVTVH